MSVHWYDLVQHPEAIDEVEAAIEKWLSSEEQ
jgi:hypothetical protein